MSSTRSSRRSCAARRRPRARPATACSSATARPTFGSSANTSTTWSSIASKDFSSRQPATARASRCCRSCASAFRSCFSIARCRTSTATLVVSDSIAGARKLTEHLIRVGHRRIAHFTDSDDVSTGRDRLQGYRQALETAGIPYLRRSHLPNDRRSDRRLSRRAAHAWRSIRFRPRSSLSTT